jgi:hypothetical protein
MVIKTAFWEVKRHCKLQFPFLRVVQNVIHTCCLVFSDIMNIIKHYITVLLVMTVSLNGCSETQWLRTQEHVQMYSVSPITLICKTLKLTQSRVKLNTGYMPNPISHLEQQCIISHTVIIHLWICNFKKCRCEVLLVLNFPCLFGILSNRN